VRFRARVANNTNGMDTKTRKTLVIINLINLRGCP